MDESLQKDRETSPSYPPKEAENKRGIEDESFAGKEAREARIAELAELIDEAREEIAWYIKTDIYREAIATGKPELLANSKYMEELEDEMKDFLEREDVRGDLEKERAIKVLFDFIRLPIREIERSRRRQRKLELISKSRSKSLEQVEVEELKELSRQDALLNLKDAELANNFSAFLINNGSSNPELVEKFWQTFGQVLLEPKRKKQLRAGFIGPAAFYNLVVSPDASRFDFKFTKPEEDVYNGIDLYLINRTDNTVHPVQIKYRQEFKAYEKEEPQGVSVIHVQAMPRRQFLREKKLPGFLSVYRQEIARFADGLYRLQNKDSERFTISSGLFVIIPGKLVSNEGKTVPSVDRLAQPSERFRSWFYRAFI